MAKNMFKGFLLGLLLAFIGVFLAYVFTDNDDIRTGSWMGLGLLFLLSFALGVLTL